MLFFLFEKRKYYLVIFPGVIGPKVIQKQKKQEETRRNRWVSSQEPISKGKGVIFWLSQLCWKRPPFICTFTVLWGRGSLRLVEVKTGKAALALSPNPNGVSRSTGKTLIFSLEHLYSQSPKGRCFLNFLENSWEGSE